MTYRAIGVQSVRKKRSPSRSNATLAKSNVGPVSPRAVGCVFTRNSRRSWQSRVAVAQINAQHGFNRQAIACKWARVSSVVGRHRSDVAPAGATRTLVATPGRELESRASLKRAVEHIGHWFLT